VPDSRCVLRTRQPAKCPCRIICLNFDWLSRPTPSQDSISPLLVHVPSLTYTPRFTTRYADWSGQVFGFTATSSLKSSGIVQFLYFTVSLLLSIFVELIQSIRCGTCPFHQIISTRKLCCDFVSSICVLVVSQEHCQWNGGELDQHPVLQQIPGIQRQTVKTMTKTAHPCQLQDKESEPGYPASFLRGPKLHFKTLFHAHPEPP
jgi:hypothetical protein